MLNKQPAASNGIITLICGAPQPCAPALAFGLFPGFCLKAGSDNYSMSTNVSLCSLCSFTRARGPGLGSKHDTNTHPDCVPNSRLVTWEIQS